MDKLTYFSLLSKSAYPTLENMEPNDSSTVNNISPNSNNSAAGQIPADLESEVVALREENQRLQEESQTAAQQLRRFTEWFFQTVQNDETPEISTTESNTHPK